MRQILQNLGSGETILVDVPRPSIGRHQVLIRTSRSVVSLGTERMLVEFGKASLIDKARQQPDKVRGVLDKAMSDGVLTTVDAVRSKLSQPIPLGYSQTGVVEEVGDAVTRFVVGDRVVSNGAHASLVAVGELLVSKVPDEVDDEAAAFTVVASIALQGIRLLAPTLGETVVVSGLGIIGLFAVQILRASGARVVGIDFDSTKLDIARAFGAETVDLSSSADPVAAVARLTDGRGADGVLICAATKSSEPTRQAAQMSRKRGRIVLVGVVGPELDRADFYEKELSFQVSCSYGPGRYDPNYEARGADYPLGFVRWTQNRNFDAVLELMRDARLSVERLVTSRVPFADATGVYADLGGAGADIGIVLDYSGESPASLEVRTVSTDGDAVVGKRRASATAAEGRGTRSGAPTVSFIGAGNYASRILAPAFADAGVTFRTCVSSGGTSATQMASKFGFGASSTDVDAALEDPATDIIVVATRHDSHAKLVVKALAAGKHVFVEKPLALNLEELDAVRSAVDSAPDAKLLVGFNRRMSRWTRTVKTAVDAVAEPKVLVATMNAGDVPPDSWLQNRQIGGGRIVGEACHMIDLLRHLAGAEISDFSARSVGAGGGVAVRSDRSIIDLTFADGSIGTVLYLANGGKRFPKERIEVFAGGAVLQIDNFRAVRSFGWRGVKTSRGYRVEKGNGELVSAFVSSVRENGESPISLDELFEVSRVSVEVADSLPSP